MTVEREQEIRRLMALPYQIELIPDDDVWFVRIPDLPGCISQGDTQEEALTMIRDAQYGWIATALSDGESVPPPRPTRVAQNGRLLVRMPRSIHRALAEAAAGDGVSINTMAVAALSHAIGFRSGAPVVQATEDMSERKKGGDAPLQREGALGGEGPEDRVGAASGPGVYREPVIVERMVRVPDTSQAEPPTPIYVGDEVVIRKTEGLLKEHHGEAEQREIMVSDDRRRDRD